MEHDTDILFSSKVKDKTRRRSSIFSLLKRQKKLSRQVSEPGPLPRKFSVDSAILSDFRKMEGYKVFLESRRDVECNGNGELAGAASDTDSEGSRAGMAEGTPDPARRGLDPAQRVHELYAGELVEEVAEENKSLLWFLLKQVRPGMDLSKVVLPTFILEPRSFLDKLSDNYYHADILSL
ncbi:hypothetical protein MSG28_015960 [Choristoneura fumiferana]|uniref:Uncharacterized protein n=1 Tax=Choristoneura fumiferana TaxID=7141 RepID=A0ACC0K4Q3_CHOFU|nr:hypothetical protein MSG28_015960 [Choristoneura fumiferana]